MMQEEMAKLLSEALRADGISQAELSRRTGISAKHINRFLNCKQGAASAMIEYWAFAIGREWKVQLVHRT